MRIQVELWRETKNPKMGVVPMCRNMKMEWLPSMAIQWSPKMWKEKTKWKIRVLVPKTQNPQWGNNTLHTQNYKTSTLNFNITKLSILMLTWKNGLMWH